MCYGQPIGAIVAETREIARSAIWLVKVEYGDLNPILTVEVSKFSTKYSSLNALILLTIKQFNPNSVLITFKERQ